MALPSGKRSRFFPSRHIIRLTVDSVRQVTPHSH
ncbi:hypothetical protein CGRA01v4_12345 [Colletotrichum graminicola]|nr:hypothetical protein CGRA01v4_12345 [Colletotrichum graminicola]